MNINIEYDSGVIQLFQGFGNETSKGVLADVLNGEYDADDVKVKQITFTKEEVFTPTVRTEKPNAD
jgi:hypothetical protein